MGNRIIRPNKTLEAFPSTGSANLARQIKSGFIDLYEAYMNREERVMQNQQTILTGLMNADIAYGEKLANLGIVQDEISGLSPLDSSDRKGAINVLDKLYSGERLNKKEIGGLINQYRGNITGSQNKLSSYSLGKMAYDEVDINNDGQIDYEEFLDMMLAKNVRPKKEPSK